MTESGHSSVDGQVDLIHRAWELMQRRTALIASDPSIASDFNPLVVLIDDFIALRGALLFGCSHPKTKTDPSTPLAEIAAIANLGRAAGVLVGLSVGGSLTNSDAAVGGTR